MIHLSFIRLPQAEMLVQVVTTFYNNHGNGHVMGGVIHVVKQNGTYENLNQTCFWNQNKWFRRDTPSHLTSHGSWETFTKDSVNIDIANTQASGNNEAFIYARYGSTGRSWNSFF